MKIDSIDIEAAVQKARLAIDKDEQLSVSTRSIIEVLIVLISLLAGRLNLNSKNSSKPPSSDPNREKTPAKKRTGKKPGGQKGHVGKTLAKVDDPDFIESIKIDRRALPPGRYTDVRADTRMSAMSPGRYLILTFQESLPNTRHRSSAMKAVTVLSHLFLRALPRRSNTDRGPKPIRCICPSIS